MSNVGNTTGLAKIILSFAGDCLGEDDSHPYLNPVTLLADDRSPNWYPSTLKLISSSISRGHQEATSNRAKDKYLNPNRLLPW
jgi:hypothetical protein